MPDINPLMNAVSELLYNRSEDTLHPDDRTMLEDAYLGVERQLSEAEEARTNIPADRPMPKCEECGNDDNLYETIDARWDKDTLTWHLERREDDGGGELDCLNCDHRGESEGVFPYGTEVPLAEV